MQPQSNVSPRLNPFSGNMAHSAWSKNDNCRSDGNEEEWMLSCALVRRETFPNKCAKQTTPFGISKNPVGTGSAFFEFMRQQNRLPMKCCVYDVLQRAMRINTQQFARFQDTIEYPGGFCSSFRTRTNMIFPTSHSIAECSFRKIVIHRDVRVLQIQRSSCQRFNEYCITPCYPDSGTACCSIIQVFNFSSTERAVLSTYVLVPCRALRVPKLLFPYDTTFPVHREYTNKVENGVLVMLLQEYVPAKEVVTLASDTLQATRPRTSP
jgi:hypothetical protein